MEIGVDVPSDLEVKLAEECSHFLSENARWAAGDCSTSIAVEQSGVSYQWIAGSEAGTAGDDSSLVAQLRGACERFVAEHSPTHVFVHAGVVTIANRAFALPGASFRGKSTAVAALVRAGARYYSDEYAAVRADGLIDAFPRPLNRRDRSGVQWISLDGGGPPARLRHVVLTKFVPAAVWKPHPVDPGAGLLKLIENTVGARTDPPRVLEHLTRMIEGAEVWEGVRGEADEFAAAVLDQFG